VWRLFTKAEAAFGSVDVLVNNAGVLRFGPFMDVTEQTFHAHYNINVLGSILTMQETAKPFGPEGGSIININAIYPIPCRLIPDLRLRWRSRNAVAVGGGSAMSSGNYMGRCSTLC
jgi:NAD(P)-dependent dehydrogenase (short-subunit alcohol dehydrogenase family)